MLVFIQISCKKKEILNKENEKPLEIEILNKEIYYSSVFTTPIGTQENDYNYPLNYENNQLMKGRNIINFKIINNSNDPYFFILNIKDITFNTIDNPFYEQIGLLDYQFYKEKSKINSISNIKYRTKDVYNVFLMDSLKKYQDRVVGDSLYFVKKQILNNSFVLQPNEYRIFTAVVCLPILQELDNPFENTTLFVPLYPGNEDYSFSLKYSLNFNSIEKFLHKETLDYLKRGNIKIFKSTVESNKVKIIER